MEEAGLEAAWGEMQTLTAWRKAEGHWAARRAQQARHWFEEEVRQGLLARLSEDAEIIATMGALAAQVADGALPPSAAAEQMLSALR